MRARTRMLLFGLLLLPALPALPALAQGGGGTAIPTPAPPAGAKTGTVEVRPLPTPPPEPAVDPCRAAGKAGCPGVGEARVVQETRSYHYHTHQIFLSADTVSQALDGALRASLAGESRSLSASVGMAAGATGAVMAAFQGGVAGDLAGASRAVLPAAAALALPLFLLRLAIFHWNRLLGDEDSPLRVAADWIVAAFWAAASGPLTAMVAGAGFQLAGRVAGPLPEEIARFQPGLVEIGGLLMLGPLLNLLVGLGYIVGIAGLLWALAAGYALLYLLAVLGPIAGVARAVPHMRWLSALWLKGVVLAALLPAAAGVVMRAAAMALPHVAFSSGLAAAAGRLVFLYGAVGMILALAGAAARFSLGAATEAAAGTVRAAKGIVGMAVLAGGLPGLGAAVGAAGAAGALPGAEMIRSGLMKEAAGRALDLPALAAAGAWEREVGRMWMGRQIAARGAEEAARFEAAVIGPLYREALRRDDGEGWAFRRFLEGYREGMLPAVRAGRVAPPGEGPDAAAWQERLRERFREAFRRFQDAPLVGGETWRALGRQAAAEEIGGRT